jgi:hypothetical protein
MIRGPYLSNLSLLMTIRLASIFKTREMGARNFSGLSKSSIVLLSPSSGEEFPWNLSLSHHHPANESRSASQKHVEDIVSSATH